MYTWIWEVWVGCCVCVNECTPLVSECIVKMELLPSLQPSFTITVLDICFGGKNKTNQILTTKSNVRDEPMPDSDFLECFCLGIHSSSFLALLLKINPFSLMGISSKFKNNGIY